MIGINMETWNTSCILDSCGSKKLICMLPLQSFEGFQRAQYILEQAFPFYQIEIRLSKVLPVKTRDLLSGTLGVSFYDHHNFSIYFLLPIAYHVLLESYQ